LIVKTALLLAPLVFVRPGELRQAEWSGIDLDRDEWRYHVTKTKTEQLVPLTRQAVAVESGGFALHYPAIAAEIFTEVSLALFHEQKLEIVYRARSRQAEETQPFSMFGSLWE
jgi:integrase